MSSDQHVEFEGTVIFDTKGCFKIQLENGEEINAKPSGKMRQNKIQILVGDKVLVECSVYDMKNGRITKRISAGNKKSATDRNAERRSTGPGNGSIKIKDTKSKKVKAIDKDSWS